MPDAAVNSQVNSFTSFPCCCLEDPPLLKHLTVQSPLNSLLKFSLTANISGERCNYWIKASLAFSFFFHMPSVYPVHLSLFALLELFLLFGARIMLLFMLTQPQSSGHFVPLAGSSPDREHQGKTHGPTHNSVTRVLWVVSYGRTSSFSGNSSQPTVNAIVVGAPS